MSLNEEIIVGVQLPREPELDEEQVLYLRKKKRNRFKWSFIERPFIQKVACRNQKLANYGVPFSLALKQKLKKSVYGSFLEEFNYQQHQDQFLNENKLDILDYHIKCLSRGEIYDLGRANNVSEDLIEHLKHDVAYNDVIDWHILFKKLNHIRLNRYSITRIDKFLKNFEMLEALILNGNFIETVKGSYLPKKIKFLEFYSNNISSVEDLAKNPPYCVGHLNLGRNRLTNDSKIHLISKSQNFTFLGILDLSYNDIYDLEAILTDLDGLNFLRALFLEGNPCSVVVSYKEAVISHLPNLVYLDGTKFYESDRVIGPDYIEYVDKAQLQIFIHRIINLPKPPKEKTGDQLFYLEFDIPLMEQVSTDELIEVKLAQPTVMLQRLSVDDKLRWQPNPLHSLSPSRATEDFETAKERQTFRPKAKPKEWDMSTMTKDPFDKPNEFNKDLFKSQSTRIVSEKFRWDKIIRPGPIYLEPPDNNLTYIRDTLKSCVTVNIVYLKVTPSKRKKEPTKSAKKQHSMESVDDYKIEERILEKITIASFNCHLRTINWSDQSIDFYWADHTQCYPDAIPVEGSLAALNYVEKKSAKDRSQKGSENAGTIRSEPVQFPKIFTCQLGFGLKRMMFTI